MSIFDTEYVARVVAQGRSDALRYAAPDGGYNGWSNHPTWNAVLVLDNDQGTYASVREVVREALESEASEPADLRWLHSVADAVRAWCEAESEYALAGLFICPELVNWPEVAWSIIEGLEGDDA